MDVVSKENNALSAKKIILQKQFKEYTDENGFSYKDWLNPPAGHFFESYKREIDKINEKMSPALTYNS